ncbi:RHS repeat-associated core domain-containing protein [Rhodanobacter sp. UC4451_H18]
MNDPDTGLVYMQARYYDPAVGRFLSVDPVGPSPGNTFNFTRYDYANANPINRTDPTGRVTFCDSKFCVTTADTANSHRSMKTIEAGAKIQAAATKGIGVVAVHSGSKEKAGFVEKGSDTVSPAKHVRNGSTATGVTAKVEVPSNAVAMVHGHIDSGPQESNGMVDDPKSNGGYGDTQSLKIGIPQGTVSHGQIGWHEMVDGRLQFSYPAGALNSKQTDQMQNNLNVEQKLFQ